MSTGGIIAIVVVVVIVLIIAMVIGAYNSLVKLDERVNEAWSDITVQLKYRADLIPNVVETVKGYAKHEKETFQMVTEARSAVMGAKTVKQAAEAEKEMQSALGRIFAIAESYPELKANENFVNMPKVFSVNTLMRKMSLRNIVSLWMIFSPLTVPFTCPQSMNLRIVNSNQMILLIRI